MMFNQSDTVFLLTLKKKQYKIYRLKCDTEVKSIFVEVFNRSLKNTFTEFEEIDFQLGYNLNEDEIWKIENFQIPTEIISAIDNPDAIESYFPVDETGITTDGYTIKSIFMGKYLNEKPYIKFQRFEKSQIIKNKRLAIIFKKDIFVQNHEFCLNILEASDAVYYDETLKFINYANANKVIPLGDYYRQATQEEVDSFKASLLFTLENETAFDKYASAHNVRGQIAKILDSGVLSTHSASSLKEIANNYNIEISIQNNKIVIPSKKKEIKYFLTFLSEKIYKGPLTGKTLISSSTREKED